ncbi:MAG: right-handed parallel beta-helix repeat-containing protein [Acidobacteria bacterium]|nr:right-handed parallel beta-helix repeat-containing protein [Acidobacteriota bacterium]
MNRYARLIWPALFTLLCFVLFLGAKAESAAPLSAAQCRRPSLPAPGENSIAVGSVEELFEAVRQANSGGNMTILIKNGTYMLKQQLVIRADRVTVRSLSGRRDDVILRGEGMTGSVSHVFEVMGKSFTAADLTIGSVRNHGIQIHGELDADFPLIHNVHIVNTGEQMIKVSGGARPGASSDGGIVEWCVFQYLSGVGPQYYIGGIDAHGTRNWIVRNNLFRSIRSPEKMLAEHAIHFWSEASNTLVERNIIAHCDRGIGFGMGSNGHVGGMIRNNMISTTRDVGIGLESCLNAKVLNNTVYTRSYPNSIEYRFPRSRGNIISNNLTTAAVAGRNNGAAIVQNNLTKAQASWFVNSTTGDLHLGKTAKGLANQGQILPEVTDDLDCEPRPQDRPYILGADE